MRIGVIVQPHRTGLGIQQMEFCRAMKPEKVLITDLTKLHANNSRNGKVVTSTDWFNDYERMAVDGVPNENACKWLLEGIDVLFVCETPLNWDVFKWAREMGVKTVLQSNFEFLEYFTRPVPKPDLLLAPSRWNIDKIKQLGPTKYLPVPVARDRIERRKITKAKRFLHIAGHKTYMDRDGTEIVRECLRFIKNPDVELKIHDQTKKEADNYWDLYTEGDVLLLPRRYGGLSLKLQEAAAAGMPIIVGEHDPYAGEASTLIINPPYTHVPMKLKAQIDAYSASPQELARIIDDLSRRGDISKLSDEADAWAEKRSWQTLKPEYEKVFEGLCA